MLEILFKAKTKDTSEWVEGCHVYEYSKNKHYIFRNQIVCPNCMNDSRIDFSLCDYEIYPETLRIYTGKKDIENQKIFTGDIIQSKFGELYIVKIYENEIRAVSIKGKKTGRMSSKYWEFSKVIGNIFDNPELSERS